MNIFLHELKACRKSTLAWIFTLIIVIIVFLSLYPAFTKDAQLTTKMLEGFPEAVRKAIGVRLDSFFSILGFYSFIYTYIVLCGSIQAMNSGLSILSKEVRDRTTDFLLTKPITRYQIVTAKLLASFASLVFTNIVFIPIAYIVLSILKTENFNLLTFLLITFSLFLIQLLFFAMGVLISVLIPKIKSVITISLSIVFGFFILDLFNGVINDKVLRYFTPYKYFDYIYIIQKNRYETHFIIIIALFTIISISLSYIIYSRKDFLI
jgi:ABC-2 type transport system permease protein